MTAERTLFAKVADADSGKIARWLKDRIRRIGWHVKRLKVVVRDARHPRNLPPGSLAASCLREATSDDRFYLKGLKRYGPLFKVFWGSGNLKVCVIGLPLGKRLMSRCSASLRPVSTDITPLVPAEYLRAMDPAIHPHYRHLFMGALRDDLVSAWEPVIRDIVRRELDGLASGGEADRPPPEQLSVALNRISTRTLLLVVLGVRPESAVVPKLEALYQRMGPGGYVAHVGSEQLAAFPEIRALVLQILQSTDNDGSLSDSILRRLARRGSGDAVDGTMIGNAIYMVERGRHDLRDLLRWMVKYLSDNLAVIAELRANLARPGAAPRLAEACVLETLRLDQAEVVNRKAIQSFEFDGYHIPKGSGVSILLRESHRDAANFVEPDRFRPQRFLERTYSADQYAPFGIDEHQCIGRFLVSRVGAIFVEELVGGYTWTVVGDGPRQYGQFHWQPSPSFAIDLKRNPAQA